METAGTVLSRARLVEPWLMQKNSSSFLRYLIALGCAWILLIGGVAGTSFWADAARAQAPQPGDKPAQPAQAQPEAPDRLSAGRISMPIDRNARRKLDSVKEYVAKEQWGEAVQVLQSLLNKTEET